MARVLILLTLLVTQTAFCAFDSLRYLQTAEWVAEDKPAGIPETLRGINTEWYYVRSRTTGQAFALITGHHNMVLQVLASHDLAEAVGLPHTPAWPVLFERGENGIPTLQDLKNNIGKTKLFSPENDAGSIVDVSVGDGYWATGVLFPIFAVDDEIRELDPGMLLLELKQRIFAIALGSDELIKNHIDGIPQFFYANHTLSQTTFQPEKLKLKPVFESLWRPLQNLPPEHAQWVADELARFFDLLEFTAAKNLRHLFFPFVSASEEIASSMDKISALSMNTVGKLQVMVAGLRPVFEEYLTKQIGGNFRSLKLTKRELPIETFVTPSHFEINAYETITAADLEESVLRTTARHWLDYYARATRYRQRGMFTKLASLMNTSDPIARLLDIAARWDGSVRLSSVQALSARPGLHRRKFEAQSYWNWQISPTLLVYAANDWEGETIDEITKEIPPTLPVHAMRIDTERGRELDDARVQSIIAEAARLRVSEIVLVENGGLNQAQLAKVQSMGFRFRHLDHHLDGKRTAWHRYSSLEQVADLLGYRLSIYQYIVGLQDRAGVYAFKQLGWDRQKAHEYFHFRRSERLTNMRQAFARTLQTDADNMIAFVTGYEEAIGTVNLAAGLVAYPQVPTLVVERHGSIAISGSPQLVEDWYNRLAANRYVQSVLGGDYNGSLFLILRPQNGNTLAALSKSSRDFLANSVHLQNPCVVDVVLAGF